MSANFMAIKAAIYEMGLFFNQQPSDDRINAYAKALSNYTDKQIIFAFKKVINSGSPFFPSLAEILTHLRPAREDRQDLAPQVANEILQLLRWYGPHDELNMLEKASEEARLTILALGSTREIRNSDNVDVVRAQLERLAKGVLGSRAAAEKNAELTNIGVDVKNVISLKKTQFQTIDYSGFLPDEPA